MFLLVVWIIFDVLFYYTKHLIVLDCTFLNILNIFWQISDQDDSLPMPIVHIDQDSDAYATIVQLSFGDRLGALLDTVILFHFLLLFFNGIYREI